MLLRAKYVIPVTSDYIEDGAVLVKGERIVEVGAAADLVRAHPDEEVRDFGQAALMPGFVDLHTHLGFSALRGMFDDLPYAQWKRAVLRTEPFFTEEDWLASARVGAMEAVASGITTVADITSRGKSFDAVQEIGLRGRIYQEVLTSHADRAEQVVADGLASLERMRETADTRRIDFGIAPGPVYACHPKVLRAVAECATEHELPLALHVAGSREEVDFVRYGSSPFSVHATDATHDRQRAEQKSSYQPWLPAGTSPVRYVYDWGVLSAPEVLAIHCVHVDDDDIQLLADNDVAVAYCPRIHAKLGMGTAPVAKMRRAGLRVGFGTDSPCATDTTDMIEETRFGLMLTRSLFTEGRTALTAKTALELATIESARALCLDGEIGSLEAGKLADVIAIDLHNSHQNPTTNPESAVVYTANQDNVQMTMVGGRVLYDGFSHVSGIDRDANIEAVRKLRARLRERSGDDELHDKLVEDASVDRKDRYDR